MIRFVFGNFFLVVGWRMVGGLGKFVFLGGLGGDSYFDSGDDGLE